MHNIRQWDRGAPARCVRKGRRRTMLVSRTFPSILSCYTNPFLDGTPIFNIRDREEVGSFLGFVCKNVYNLILIDWLFAPTHRPLLKDE